MTKLNYDMFKIIAIEIPADSRESMIEDFKGRIQGETMQIQEELIRRKKERYNSVMKILGDNVDRRIYKFYRDYEINNGWVTRKKKSQVLDDYFKEDSDIDINLCAIVGKNGCGKSTLLEIMLRLLNNTAYALREVIDSFNSAQLFFAECVYARMYFENEAGDCCYVEQKDMTIEWVNQKHKEKNWSYTHNKDQKPQRKGGDMTPDECVEMLQSMFYTIEVNYSAYAHNPDDLLLEWHRHDEERGIRNYSGSGCNGRSEVDNPKKERCWIESLFHKNDGYQMPVVLNPYRADGNIDVNSEKELLNERLFLLLLDNQEMLTALLGNKRPCEFVFERHEGFLPQGFSANQELFNTAKVNGILEETGNQGIERNTSNDEIGKRIIECWERCYGYKFVNDIDGLTLERDGDKIAALNYIVYKTIKIPNTYGKYSGFSKTIESPEKLVMALYCDMSHISLKLRRAIAYLTFGHYGTGMAGEVSGGKMEVGQLIKSVNGNAGTQIGADKGQIVTAYKDNEFLESGLKRRGNWERDELLPMSCVKTTIALESEGYSGKGSDIRLDTLSSGEKQIVYSFGAMTYQLHHINSVSGQKLQYHCVNLIFDELDLYFHPEYQKQVVMRLVEIIKSMKSKAIRQVNVIIATHSPFILSDIPQNNILYLKEGEDVSKGIKVNPLGANINDILRQSFFLDRFVGEFVSEKIEKLINDINGISESDEEKCFSIEEAIEMIGDPFIKEQLWALYCDKRFSNDPKKEIKWLENRIDQIKKDGRYETDKGE